MNLATVSRLVSKVWFLKGRLNRIIGSDLDVQFDHLAKRTIPNDLWYSNYLLKSIFPEFEDDKPLSHASLLLNNGYMLLQAKDPYPYTIDKIQTTALETCLTSKGTALLYWHKHIEWHTLWD